MPFVVVVKKFTETILCSFHINYDVICITFIPTSLTLLYGKKLILFKAGLVKWEGVEMRHFKLFFYVLKKCNDSC